MTKDFRPRRIPILVVVTMLFVISSASIAQTIMNGKEVRAYTGQIISHNERTGQIVVKTDNSTGHWRLSHHTVVLSGRERLNLADVWGKTKRVEVFVSRDGEVERINVLEWK